jgi:hypothetical protein
MFVMKLRVRGITEVFVSRLRIKKSVYKEA